MKKLIIAIALLLAGSIFAQSGQERVMLQQIAALKTYGAYIQKGYRIAKGGLDFIGNVKDGELGLHTLFFDGLEHLSPVVRDYPKVAGFFELNRRIAALGEQLGRHASGDLFYGNEKDYIRRVIARVLSGCADDIEALRAVLEEGSITADDAERLTRIDALFAAMEDRYAFARSFYSQCAALAAARQNEQKAVRQARELYHLNQTQ